MLQVAHIRYDVKEIMFNAGDEKGHTVCWSGMSGCWMLENKDGDLKRYPQDVSIILPLIDLQSVSGVESNDWFVTDNPYGGD
jgi:hypothetical protein